MTMYNPKTYDILLKSITSAHSAAELGLLRGMAQTHYAGVMRIDLEAAVATRQLGFPDATGPADTSPPESHGAPNASLAARWERASLGDLRRAIERRWREFDR
jgi:hypothetical protein